MGKHLAQRLVAAGERVVDVSTRRAALVRVFAGGNGRKNDDIDAHSVAVVGLHSRDLPEVRRDDHSAALRLLANRRKELVDLRTQCVNRLHRDLVGLISGGVPQALTAVKAKALLASIRPRDEMGRLRRRLAADQLADLVALDKKLGAVEAEDRHHFASYNATAPDDKYFSSSSAISVDRGRRRSVPPISQEAWVGFGQTVRQGLEMDGPPFQRAGRGV